MRKQLCTLPKISFMALTMLVIIMSSRYAYTAQVTLSWDPNSESDLMGYRIFSRTEYQDYDYYNTYWEGMETTCTLYDLDDNTIYYFVARAFDTEGNESADSNEVVYQPDHNNAQPLAEAGPGQTVNEGATVLLDGSNSSDPDDGIFAHQWTQLSGVAVTLSDPTSSQPTFTAPDVGPDGASLTFRLTVTDNGGLQATDTCIVNVTWENEPPVANAGTDQTVFEGNSILLDGSNSSDPDDGIFAHQWTQLSGVAVTLSDPTSSQPTFTTPDVGPDGASLTFQLTVTDNGGLQATDSCSVNVSAIVEDNYDIVTIINLEYLARRRRLNVNAASTHSGSATLTAMAHYGSTTEVLGILKYRVKSDIYKGSFGRVKVKPDAVTVESSLGGSEVGHP